MAEHSERRLYAAWRNPEGLIRPVGVLTKRSTAQGDSYRFVYLKAAEQFEGFQNLPELPDMHRFYDSEQLFPVFRNRVMPRRRPDYGEYFQKLNLDSGTDPFKVLIRSEGQRATDRVEVFAHPERTAKGNLTTLFFARGIRHLPGAAEAVDGIRKGDVLELHDEPGNSVNRRAVLISTRSGRRVGWAPDCLVEMIHDLSELDAALKVTAEHVNPADVAAPHMRLLCRLRSPWPKNYEPLHGPEYQPIAST